MAKLKRKPLKRELKEDKFVSTTFALTDWSREHSTTIWLALGVICLLVIGAYFIKGGLNVLDEEASDLLSRAGRLYEAAKYEQAITIYERIAKDYSGSSSNDEAIFFLGNCYFNIEKYAESQKQFEKYVKQYGKNGQMGKSAVYGLAQSYIAQDDFIKAAETYSKLTHNIKKEGLTKESLNNMGLCYKEAGEYQKAKESFQKIKDLYPDTQEAKDVTAMIYEMEMILSLSN